MKEATAFTKSRIEVMIALDSTHELGQLPGIGCRKIQVVRCDPSLHAVHERLYRLRRHHAHKIERERGPSVFS